MDEEQTAKKACVEASKIIMDHFKNRGGQRMMKGERDFATLADHAAEKEIIRILLRDFPNYNILAEESGEINNGSEYTWIIDPLDGTHNFAWGLPMFATGIALEKKDEILLCAVGIPTTGEILHAIKGKGCYINDSRTIVSKRSYPGCMVEFGGASAIESRPEIKDAFKLTLDKFHSHFRLLGSIIYTASTIAKGDIDGYVGFMEKPWDIAPGILLVQEAGGMSTDTSGRPANSRTKDIVYSNGIVHSQIIQALKP